MGDKLWGTDNRVECGLLLQFFPKNTYWYARIKLVMWRSKSMKGIFAHSNQGLFGQYFYSWFYWIFLLICNYNFWNLIFFENSLNGTMFKILRVCYYIHCWLVLVLNFYTHIFFKILFGFFTHNLSLVELMFYFVVVQLLTKL